MQTIKKTLLTLLLASITSTNAFAVNEIERVSLDTSGNNPNQNNRAPSVTSNSRFIVFESDATDLVAGDSNGFTDIFRFDRTTSTTIRVSVTNGGGEADQRSTVADVSDDGRFIVFASTAQNLTSETDTNGLNDIFLRDTLNNTTTLISKSIGGTTGNGASLKPVISDDGTVIAYESLASDILAADADTTSDVYRYIVASGTTELVSTGASGKGSAKSQEASLSFNGQIIAFSSDAFNLGGPLTDRNRDAFYRNFNTGTTIAITTGASDPGFTDSQQPYVSGDGSTIIFESFRRNLVANDNNGVQDVFAYNVNTTAITRVSVSSAGVEGDARSGHPGVSASGRYVVFESTASTLDANDTNGALDIFTHDRTTNKTTRISLDINGNQGGFLNQKPKISSTGRFVVFSSLNTLDSGDSNGFEDIYLYEKTSRNDFNSDGNSDILWRNNVSNLNKIYLMNGKSITTDANFAYAGEASWEVAGIGDFDDDGNDDILWRNSVSTLNHIAFMSGTTVDGSKSADFNGLPDTNWKVVGIGDFNNDRFDDILWRNDVTGENRLFLMQGTTILSELFIDSVPDNNWKVAGVADFNFDKKADILWRHDVNRRVWLYLMDSNTITNGAGVGEHIAFTSENWDIQGVGDSNDDGKSDILWRHNVNGRVWMYLMDGTTILNSTGSAPGEHVAFTALAWEIKATGDYNGDGKDDLFWRHSVSGDNWMYLQNGASIINGGGIGESVNVLSDLNWNVQDK